MEVENIWDIKIKYFSLLSGSTETNFLFLSGEKKMKEMEKNWREAINQKSKQPDVKIHGRRNIKRVKKRML